MVRKRPPQSLEPQRESLADRLKAQPRNRTAFLALYDELRQRVRAYEGPDRALVLTKLSRSLRVMDTELLLEVHRDLRKLSAGTDAGS